jgi:hypothetical protein
MVSQTLRSNIGQGDGVGIVQGLLAGLCKCIGRLAKDCAHVCDYYGRQPKLGFDSSTSGALITSPNEE